MNREAPQSLSPTKQGEPDLPFVKEFRFKASLPSCGDLNRCMFSCTGNSTSLSETSLCISKLKGALHLLLP